jgi:hypothetical protein
LADTYLTKISGGDPGARIVDKMPFNFIYLGLITLALPAARTIHLSRAPLDTCLSCYATLFADGHAYSYDLAEIGRTYRSYHELMAHWRAVLPAGSLLDVRYEDLVADLEGQTRRMLEYCGLPWDERCLAFHESKRTVRTASASQVREPIYKSSIGRWRAYAHHLGPLIEELGDLAEA